MKPVSIIGIILIVLGLVALSLQGFSYVTREKKADFGPIVITKEEEKHVPLPPIVGIGALASGVALVAIHTLVGVMLLGATSPGVYLRYLAPLVPPLFALAGLCVGALARAWPALGAAAAAAWVLSGPLAPFVYELTHDYDGPIEGIVGYLRHHAQPGDTVAIVYGDLPLKFYTDLRVVGGLTGEDLEAARGAEWIVLRATYNPAPVTRATRETLRRFLAEGDYERIVLDAPELPFENREDVRFHEFRTVEAARRVEIWRRRR